MKNFIDVPIDNLNVGDAVGDMHMHQVNTGLFMGWDMQGRFEITQTQFDALLAKSQTNGELIQNKIARVVSFTVGDDDNIGMLLVIYSYDHTYWCATLFRPEPGVPAALQLEVGKTYRTIDGSLVAIEKEMDATE